VLPQAAARLAVCLGLAAATLIALAVPSTAAAAACPSVDTSYMENCGPQFAVPNWTDAGGWSDPSKYSTIRLADVNGDGRDELIGRSDAGLQIFWFDTTLGQWRPQVDANGVRQVLTDFASPPQWNKSDPHSPARPQYYSTIQAVDIDSASAGDVGPGGPGAEEILARFWDGMRVYQYFPPAGGNNIDGGTWKRVGTGGPFSDADGYGDASLYPTIQVGNFFQGAPPFLWARPRNDPMAFYFWLGDGKWYPLPDQGPPGQPVSGLDDDHCGQPSCYLSLQTSSVIPPAGRYDPDDTAEVLNRGADQGEGVLLWNQQQPGWEGLAFLFGGSSPLSDLAGEADCPFSVAGASGPGSGDCLGGSPSYYETLQTAGIDGEPGDEILARASDGLRLWTWSRTGAANTGEEDLIFGARLPTLTALAGAASSVADGMWGSIRTADLDGNGKQEVLALDGNGLQAWSYDPASRAWGQWQPSTPLTLASDPWSSHPEYYSTIQTGDVDGDHRDDVIARGPSGIRTWFYNRRGTGGWERYLPEGYPAFAGGQQNAFEALTALAKDDGVIADTAASVRDVWASENAPQASDLQQLQQGLVSLANCSGRNAGNPPSFQACTPPPNSSGFTAADWKAVVNQMLAENYAAGQVVAFFAQLESMRESLFIAENSELPAIGQDLGLQAAAGSTANFDFQNLFATMAGIMGEIAGYGGQEELAAALDITSYILFAIPEASPTANSTFQTTYAGLQDQFAKMVTEVDKAMLVQSQQVRQDGGLLELVGRLRSSGTWDLDTIGMESAANQGFATWVYQALMPTLYDRYQITNCGYVQYTFDCSAPSGLGVVGGGQSQNFTMIGPQHQVDQYSAEQVPCVADQSGFIQCTWNLPPGDLMNRIWGPLSSDCSYQPGQSQTAWTFGCSAGVDVGTSIGDNSWSFPNYSGDPDPYYAPGGFTSSFSAARRPGWMSSARVRARGPIVLGRPRHGLRRAVRGRALFDADIGLPRMRLAGATVRLNRLLLERRGHGELTRPRGGRAGRPLKLRLRRAGPGRYAAARAGRRSVRIALRRAGRRGRARLTLRIGAAAFRAPRACHALPASVALDTPPLHLESRLVISDGRSRYRVLLEHPVRCMRDARGNISSLVYVRNRPHRLRPGLDVTLQGPSRVERGGTARYVARVHNRRRGTRRLLSSLWDVTLRSRTSTRRIRELRRGRSSSLVFTRRVPRNARRRVCIKVVGTAAGARAASAAICAAVRGARPPGVTG
jgi:hypothetical protein